MVTIADEVWDRLDSAAGRLPGRTRLKAGLAVLVVVVGYLATWVVWQSGLVVPRLQWWVDVPVSPVAPGLMRVPIMLASQGEAPITVLELRWSAPGMHAVQGDAGRFPLELGASAAEVQLSYRVDDCVAIPRDIIPLRAVVERLGITSTVDVSPAGEQPPWHRAGCG